MITRKILEPGDRITIEVTRMYELCFCNTQMGTHSAPKGTYEVIVEKVWHDYETGYRATGRLANQADIDKLRQLYAACVRGMEPHPDWRAEQVMFAGEIGNDHHLLNAKHRT